MFNDFHIFFVHLSAVQTHPAEDPLAIMNALRTPRRSNDAGFTLIELMVVVSIIAILGAVAIPRYISYMRNSQTAEVGQIGGSIVSALQSYADSQGLTAAAAQALFDTYALNVTGTAPTKNLATLLPNLTIPSNATFNYSVSAIVATAGAQLNDVAYCINATGNANSNLTGGQVLYSSSPALATNTNWAGRVFNKIYLTGVAGLTGAVAGGYCTAAGLSVATQS